MFFILELWVLNMTSETAELYILDNLNSRKNKNKTCPKTQPPKNVWVATKNVNNLTSKSKFLLTQDIIINNWNYAAALWVLL